MSSFFLMWKFTLLSYFVKINVFYHIENVQAILLFQCALCSESEKEFAEGNPKHEKWTSVLYESVLKKA